MVSEKSALEKREAKNPEVVERTRSGIVFTPPVDIYETKDDIVLIADMPGVDEKSIDIVIEKDILAIEGKVEFTKPETLELQYSEYQIGDFQRSFTLHDTIDQNKIEASYNNGVLRLRLPKAEPAKPKKIEVKLN